MQLLKVVGLQLPAVMGAKGRVVEESKTQGRPTTEERNQRQEIAWSPTMPINNQKY